METNLASPLVLHIEDDDGDAHLVVRSLSQGSIPVRISRASDGKEALDFLAAIESRESEAPGLILLDLKLPFLSGKEILIHIRSRENIRELPVVIFTSSDAAEDIVACEDGGCNEYVVKPIEYSEFRSTVDSICKRYFGSTVDAEPNAVSESTLPDSEEPELLAAV